MTNDESLSGISARLALTTGRLNRRLRGAGGGLSHGLLSALASIHKHGPLRLAELAQLELVSAPSATRLVAELEVRGLVSRAVDPDDRRAILLTATIAGANTILVARSARAEIMAQLLAPLSRAEVAAIAAALPALEKTIE